MNDSKFHNQAKNIVVNHYTIINNYGSQSVSEIKPPKKIVDWNDVVAFIKKHWQKIIMLLGMLFPALCQ